MPILPIYHYTNSKLINPNVLHYKITPLDNFPWKYVDLKTE
jgi:ABC-type oligopeptide transport system substrate-binding subunit